MKKLLLSFGLAALLLPVLASAQEDQPQPGVYCPHLTRDLQFRDTDARTGGQVTELQKFLSDYYDDYPEWAITGNFRGTTLSYVKRFQKEQNLPAYGYVGPLTRAAIGRVCNGSYPGTPIPAPTDPVPSTPTCILKASPIFITLGQSSLLYWSSTNANSGTITTLGSVPLNGSQTVNPTQTTTYTGTFWGHQSVATCNATINVSSFTCEHAAPPTNCSWQRGATCAEDRIVCGPETNSCLLDGVEVLNGAIRKFYSQSQAANASMCQTYSMDRTCTNGTLSGSSDYRHAKCTSTEVITCEHANPPDGCHWQSGATCAQDELICYAANASCTLDGVTITHGTIRKFYSQRQAANESMCQTYSIDRTCQSGVLSGSSAYQYANCTRTDVDTTAATINITAPTNNQSFPTNSSVQISWNSQNAPAGSYVQVYLGGTPLADNQSPSGTFNWTPTLTGQSYLKVILINSSGTIYAQSQWVNVLITAY